jgi:hypothetical protein
MSNKVSSIRERYCLFVNFFPLEKKWNLFFDAETETYRVFLHALSNYRSCRSISIIRTFVVLFFKQKEEKASRRFATIIPNIHLWYRMFGIIILVLQRMFGKPVKNLYEHTVFFDDRSEHPCFSYYEHPIFLSQKRWFFEDKRMFVTDFDIGCSE